MAQQPSLTSLRAFSVVGECLSFTQAATRLGVTQSAVSRQVAALEETLDLSLFHRRGNAISLTEQGAVLHQRVFETFGLLSDALSEIQSQPERKTIHISAPPTFAARWLTRRLPEFRERFPLFDLAVHTAPEKDQRLDCAVYFGGAPNPRHSNVQLLVEEHVVVCSPALTAAPERIAAASLLHVLRDGVRLPLWDDWFSASQANRNDFPTASLDFATLEITIQAAKNEVGLAVVDRNMIEYELAAESLVLFDDTVVNGPLGYWLEITREQETRERSVKFFRWLRGAKST